MKLNKRDPRPQDLNLAGTVLDRFADRRVSSYISTSETLSNISEGSPVYSTLSMKSYCDPPRTPQETMEFLSRSWSVSASEVAKALNPSECRRKFDTVEQKCKEDEQHSPLTSTSYSFATSATAQLVMEKIMMQSDLSPFASRRSSCSNASIPIMEALNTAGSPPMSPQRHYEDSTHNVHTELGSAAGIHPYNNQKHFCRSFSGVRAPLRGMSMRRWIKDIRERKKEDMRVRNAQTYAAISVASVAAAIAAIAVSTATVSNEDNQNKTNFAVASAATLVAAQCVEIAESMGADHEQMSAVVSSAVNVRTSGDVMTLTAAAATALRAVATLKARTLRQHRSTATVIPYERGNCDAMTFSGELSTDESESDYGSHKLLRQGCDFLKRTRKGALHWRWISVFLNKHLQLIVKSQSKHMKGTITKTKTRLLREVITDMPAWPEREYATDGIHERRYFGIKTDHGVMELECKNEAEYRMWTEGITRLLSLVQRI